MPSAIVNWQWRSGDAHCNHELARTEEDEKKKEEGEEEKQPLIKSNHPHLAGREKTVLYPVFIMLQEVFVSCERGCEGGVLK